MRSRSLLISCVLMAVVCGGTPIAIGAEAADKPSDAGQWPATKANTWLKQQGWLVGCNFIPSTAVNQLEMWQADTFDPATIDRELGWAESLGFNSVRVFLHDQLWQQDAEGFLDRVDKFLAIADRHHIGTMLVLFDSCWHPVPKLGKQPAPLPFKHNSGWVQSPGRDVLPHPEQYPHLKQYVQGVLRRFGNDRRVQVWDVWNEADGGDGGTAARPGLDVANKPQLVGELLRQAFVWAREVNPSQPLTSCLWTGKWDDDAKLRPIERLQIAQSDIITFHCYDKVDEFKRCIASLRRFDRPIVCTEFMARTAGSTFDPQLGLMKTEHVGAYCWGLVSGKTQTIYPWDSWTTEYTGEPAVWFHDIFRPDGTPYRTEEVDYIRTLTGVKPAK